jgi:hypothetical protein
MFGSILISICTLMHIYLFWRIASVPPVKRHVSLNLLIGTGVLIWAIFFIGRVYGHTGIKTNLLFFTKGEPTKEIWYFEHPYPPGLKSYNKGNPIRIEEFDLEKSWWEIRHIHHPGLAPLGLFKSSALEALEHGKGL